MKILKSILNYIPLATFIIFVVTDGIFSLTSALIFVISTIGLLINWKRKKQRWRIEKIPVDISHILGNLITVIFDYQILRKPLKILSL